MKKTFWIILVIIVIIIIVLLVGKSPKEEALPVDLPPAEEAVVGDEELPPAEEATVPATDTVEETVVEETTTE